MFPGWTRHYVGLPYADHGRSRDGVDCWGLVRLVYAEQFDLILPDHGPDYGSAARIFDVAAAIEANAIPPWREIKGWPEIGDIVLLRHGRFPIHVGVYVGQRDTRPHMLHVEEGLSACIEPLDGVVWGHRIMGFYRHEKLCAR